MSATTSTLTDVLRSAHGQVSDEDSLRDQYAEFLPVPPVKPLVSNGYAPSGRARQSHEFNPEVDEQNFIDAKDSLLHNTARPKSTLKREQVEHRFLIFLYAQGMSTKDIFAQLGGEWDSTRNLPVSGTGQYSYQHLHTIRRQAWFQTKLVQYMEECGKDLIRAKFEAELMPSIDKVIEIRDDRNAPQQLQLRAAESLIDRFLGKPLQQVQALPAASVDRYEKTAADLVKETELIESELKNLNAAFLVDE